MNLKFLFVTKDSHILHNGEALPEVVFSISLLDAEFRRQTVFRQRIG